MHKNENKKRRFNPFNFYIWINIIKAGNINSWTQTDETSIIPPNENLYTPQSTINITTPLPETQIQAIPTTIQNIPQLQVQFPN